MVGVVPMESDHRVEHVSIGIIRNGVPSKRYEGVKYRDLFLKKRIA